MQAKTVTTAMFGLLLLQVPAMADSQGRCGPGDYHQTPLVDWQGCEGGSQGNYETQIAVMCRNLNESFGTSVSCTFDKKSFEAHYQVEAKKPKAKDRDIANPGDYAGQLTIGRLWMTSYLPLNIGDFMLEKGPKKEFKDKVKGVIIVYDTDPKRAPSLALEKGILVFRVPGDADHMAYEGGGWVIDALQKMFPAFKATWDEHH